MLRKTDLLTLERFFRKMACQSPSSCPCPAPSDAAPLVSACRLTVSSNAFSVVSRVVWRIHITDRIMMMTNREIHATGDLPKRRMLSRWKMVMKVARAARHQMIRTR